jgi:dihydroflavonol-4-reductase
MKALVTGATGFIGSHVARALLDDGWEVRALVRSATNGHRRAELSTEIEPAAGDIRDQAAVEAAAHGCQAVFHAAAMYDLWAPNPSQFYDVNVAGTKAVLAAASVAGVERTVYTSSVSTITPGQDETAAADPEMVHSHYKRSKILAERVALQDPNVVVVNPSTPIGWGDVRPTPTGKIVLDFLRGRMPAYVDTGLNLVDVEDVAKGHLLAWRRGQPGQRCILGHENISLQSMLVRLAKLTGRRAPRLRLPYTAAFAAGAISELIQGCFLQRRPAVPLEAVRMSRVPMYYDASRARHELGLPQTPIDEALTKAAEWFDTHDYR